MINEDTLKPKEAVTALGKELGFQQLMALSALCWKEYMHEVGWPTGCEFTLGPCRASMVPCACVSRKRLGDCKWCCGSRLLTRKVAKLQKKAAKKKK